MKNINIHRILIPVDFSPASDTVLEQGAYLANIYRADIFLLHLLEDVASYPSSWFDDKKAGADKETIKLKVEQKLSEYIENITKKYGVYAQSVITTGKLVFKIEEIVKQQDINLIVMRTLELTGFDKFFTGGVAHKVVNLSTCPVLTIKEGAHFNGYKSVVVPIDETMHSRQKVSNILPLAIKCKSQVHVLGIVENNDKLEIAKLNTKLNTVQEAVENAGLICIRKIVVGKNVALEAIKYAEAVKAELLSIMTNQESSMTGMFMGIFPRQIINHSNIPILSIKPIIGSYEAFS